MLVFLLSAYSTGVFYFFFGQTNENNAPTGGVVERRIGGARNPRSSSWTWKTRTPTIDKEQLFASLSGHSDGRSVDHVKKYMLFSPGVSILGAVLWVTEVWILGMSFFPLVFQTRCF